MGLENISDVRLFQTLFFCPSVLHFVEARVHQRTGKCQTSQEEDAFGVRSPGRSDAMWSEEIGEGLGMWEKGAPGEG